MARLEITLGSATYKQEHVSGQKLLDYFNLIADFDKNINKYSNVDVITKRLEFVASLFDAKEVTPESILEGTDPWNLMQVLDDLTKKVIGDEDSDSKKEV